MELFELLFCLLEFVVELGISLGPEQVARRVASRRARKHRRPPSAVTAIFGYLALGVLIGLLSLLVAPSLLLEHRATQFINLLVTPLACGAIMFTFGRNRAKKGEPLVRLDRFGYGALFALSVAITRFMGSN